MPRYSEYLRSDHWQQQRQAARERAGQRCEACGDPNRLEVHHLTYKRLGAELPEDLKVVCRYCHSRYHEIDKRASWDRLFGDILAALGDRTLPTNKIAKLSGRQRNLTLDALKEMAARGLVEPVGITGTWRA